ncbi:MAG: helix-turn-helix domain-containing protein [Parcubacteria group bacterium]|jgi:predicted transcriptional regulator
MKPEIIAEKAKKVLLQLGLSGSEIGIYLTLLQMGSSSVQDISRSSGINRVTIYSALTTLEKKGLVAETKKGSRRLFVAERPEELKAIVEEKEEEIQKINLDLGNLVLPVLKAIDVSQENKPEIRFYEGLEGIYKVYENMLETKDILGCGSYDSVVKVSSWKEEEKYFHRIKHKKVFYRAILEDTPTNRKFADIAKGIAHFKFLETGVKLSADIHAYGDDVALMSYEKVTATVIRDATISKSIKTLLEFMWDRL